MLIWLGVVATVLALIGVAGIVTIVWAVVRLEKRAEFLDDSQDAFLEAQKIRMGHEDLWLKDISSAFAEFSKQFRADTERFLSEWKSGTVAFTKSEQELADNLAALLREVKVSKAFAQGATALVEQNVAAVDRLWQMVEMIRRGPRTPTSIAPSDEEAAAKERGESPEQLRAIESMLAAASERARNPDDLM